MSDREPPLVPAAGEPGTVAVTVPEGASRPTYKADLGGKPPKLRVEHLCPPLDLLECDSHLERAIGTLLNVARTRVYCRVEPIDLFPIRLRRRFGRMPC